MALNTTNTTAAIAATDLFIPVAASTGMTVGRRVKINNEHIGSIVAVNGLTCQVRGRGDQGTTAQAHATLSPITFGDASDFLTPPEARDAPTPPMDVAQVVIGADLTVTIPNKNTRYVITKATAAAITLGAPGADHDGIELEFMSTTAAAHAITATTLLQDGVTGGAKTTATFAAFAGANLKLTALKNTYQVTAKNVVTVT